MAIKIKNLTVKNFMSVGNVTQAVNFDKEQLTLVLGVNLDQGGDDSGSRNGTGKTTIVNALSYALYGQALTNIKKSNLINKTNNKGMVVTLTFEKNGTEYKIERGRSPTFTKFFVNNQEVIDEVTDETQGDSRNTQEEISKLIGMSHNMFKHIVALNTTTEPFLSMRTNDQREIIEQLLGITVLSEKAETLKEQIKSTKDLITEETLKINAVEASNKKIRSSIESFYNTQRAWKLKKKQDIEKLEQSLKELEALDIENELELHDKLANWTKINNELTASNKEKSTLETALIRATNTVSKIEKDIGNLDDALCFTCGQVLHADKKEDILKEKQKELSDAIVYQNEVADKLEKIMKRIAELGDLERKPTTFYDTAKEAYDHQNFVNNIKQTIENKNNEEDPYEKQIKELEEKAIQEIDWEIVNKLTALKDHQEFLLKLLTNKDSFIRKKIIDQNLSYLNTRLTQYLDSLGLPHKVVFQNDLNVEITKLGQELDFDNLSRGEKNRLILGLSFAFRDVWESLYQNVNLLFIDELVDSGMDTSGTENALVILKKMGREGNKNVFLISHREELVGRVTNILKVVKENDFTSYETDVDMVE
jgi:DNA repair exonuclease SbcCD ATPase subunit